MAIALKALGALIVCAALVLPPVGAQPDAPAAPRFGLTAAGDDPSAAAEVGADWEQVAFEWSAFQPDTPQDFVTDSVDSQVAQAAAAGREVVGRITDTPAWASASGLPDAVPRGLDLPLNDPGNRWAALVRRLAVTYAPLGIHHWIIYDQPNVQRGEGRVFFSGSASDYAALLKTATLAARAADPKAVIFAAAPDWWADVYAGREPYLKRLLDIVRLDPDWTAYGGYFGGVVLRVYDTTAAVWNMVSATRALLDAAGMQQTALWLETNAGPTLDPRLGLTAPVPGITLDQQADFIVQAAALALAAGVERISVPLADQPDALSPWGLIRADHSRRPAFDAYRRVIDLFSLSAAVTRSSVPGVEFILLENAGQDVVVFWASGPQSVQLLITSPEVGESAILLDAQQHARTEKSGSAAWPAAFLVDAPGALRDAYGFLSVAGSPRLVVLERTDFFRVMYATVDGETIRLR